jgi:membrane protein
MRSRLQRLISVWERHRLRLPEPLILWWRVVIISYLGFGLGGSYVLAAAIAFYSIVCMGPLGILISVGLQAIFGSQTATYYWLTAAAHEMGGEASDQIITQVNGLLANPDAHIAGIVSVFTLIWAALRLFEIVERSLTGVWPGRVLRGFFRRKLVALVMMLAMGLLLASFVLANFFLATARVWVSHFAEIDPALIALLRPRFMTLIQFVLTTLTFTLVYKFVPVQPVRTGVALRGGLCGALIWHAGSPVLIYMFTRSAEHSAIYGGLAGVVLFSLWAFLGAWALLFGAHFAAAYDHVIVQRRPREEDDTLIGLPVKLTTELEEPEG